MSWITPPLIKTSAAPMPKPIDGWSIPASRIA
jgi:hypothetical protein